MCMVYHKMNDIYYLEKSTITDDERLITDDLQFRYNH